MNPTVVFVILSLFGGGAERVVSILASNLAEIGWNVHLVIYQTKDREYPISSRVKLHRLHDFQKLNPVLRRIKYLTSIRNIVTSANADVVIPFLAIPTVHTYLAVRRLNCRLITTVRNNPNLYPSNSILRNLVNFCTKHSYAVMYQTEEQRRYFEKNLNGFVVHNPVNPAMLKAEYQYRDTVQTISTFGRLDTQKNHKLLIEAFARLLQENDNIRLKIYGEGDGKKELQEYINHLGVSYQVELMGNTDKVLEKMQECDLFVLSSDYEGLPNALIEAMAVGVPCIATECPTGPKDLLGDNQCGILVPVRDVDSLVAAMKKMIDNHQIRKMFGMNAKLRIESQYSIEKVISSLEKGIIYCLMGKEEDKAWED